MCQAPRCLLYATRQHVFICKACGQLISCKLIQQDKQGPPDRFSKLGLNKIRSKNRSLHFWAGNRVES